jgi:sulfonate transport system substrate-binding protein
MQTSRRLLLAAASLFATAALLSPISARAQGAARESLRIGYQKYGTLTLLKGQGTLESASRRAAST